jgi:NAD(P)-dependent dehydrogenase (short-subunit alcohol dehydrogenase family)
MHTPNAAPYATYPSLVDRTVFITGGADGIGAAIVEEFVRQGSKVGFADINVSKAGETVARCAASNPRHTPRFYEVDLVDIDATQAAVRQAQADLGGLTVLVNNAASDERHTWDELSADDWDDRMNTNLRHYFFTIQAAAPAMIEAQNGSIINIGSSSYMMQEDFFPGYAIAKSGVEGITRTLARTFGPDNVRVNTVLPGWVATETQLT